MTPLAAQVAKSVGTSSGSRYVFHDACGLLPLFGRDLHCFEVTAVGEAVYRAIVDRAIGADVTATIKNMLLPSPVTWLEDETSPGNRTAFILKRDGESTVLMRAGGNRKPRHGQPKFQAQPMCRFSVSGDETLTLHLDDIHPDVPQANVVSYVLYCALILDMINNMPDLVEVRRHQTHKGLLRKLKANKVDMRDSEFWSEVVIQPRHLEQEGASGAVGGKCLHFVRSHYRRLGPERTTIVKAHWRGDAALGTQRTRYRLTMPKGGVKWPR